MGRVGREVERRVRRRKEKKPLLVLFGHQLVLWSIRSNWTVLRVQRQQRFSSGCKIIQPLHKPCRRRGARRAGEAQAQLARNSAAPPEELGGGTWQNPRKAQVTTTARHCLLCNRNTDHSNSLPRPQTAASVRQFGQLPDPQLENLETKKFIAS